MECRTDRRRATDAVCIDTHAFADDVADEAAEAECKTKDARKIIIQISIIGRRAPPCGHQTQRARSTSFDPAGASARPSPLRARVAVLKRECEAEILTPCTARPRIARGPVIRRRRGGGRGVAAVGPSVSQLPWERTRGSRMHESV